MNARVRPLRLNELRGQRRLLRWVLVLACTGLIVLFSAPAGMAATTDSQVSQLAPGARAATSSSSSSSASSGSSQSSDPDSESAAAAADAAAQAAALAAATPVPDSTSASTSTSTSSDSSSGGGGSAGMLSGLDTDDTHGLSISKYQMSVDTGGMTNPLKAVVNGVLLSGGWTLYCWLIGAATSLINIGLQMEWVSWLTDVITPIAQSLQTNVIDRLGLHQLALAITGLWVGVSWARGRYAAGLSQLLQSALVAGLAATILANPVQMITGDNGLLLGFRDFGQATAMVIVSNGHSTDPDPVQIQKATGGALVDTFVRIPHQMINYGQVLDGGPCQSAYDSALADGPYPSDDDSARSAVGGCDDNLKTWADDPGWQGVVSLAILAPAAGILMILAVVIVVLLFLASLMVVFTALKLIVDLITAQLPGERSGLWGSIASLAGSLVLMGLMSVMLAIYCLFLQGILGQASGQSMITRFLLIDVMLIALVIATIKMRKRLSERARSWAQRAAAASGGRAAQPVKMPKAASQVQRELTRRAVKVATGGRSSSAAKTTASAGAAASGSAVKRLGQRVAQSKVTKAAVGAATGALTVASGGTALALKSTIGAPVYAPRAARALKAATRARSVAMKAKLAKARSDVGTRVGKTRSDVGAFKDEYVGNLAAAGRGTAKAGRATGRAASSAAKAGGRKAASTVTAASIHLSTPTTSGANSTGGRPSSGAWAPKAPHRAGVATPSTAAVAAQRRAQQRDAARAAAVPTPNRSTSTPAGSPQSSGSSGSSGSSAVELLRQRMEQAARAGAATGTRGSNSSKSA